MKTRRGTAIVETANGFLLTRTKDGLFLLPGGKSEKGEPRIVTSIRELKEETNLDAQTVIFLFVHESEYYSHKVFYIQAEGNLRPRNEIDEINFSDLVSQHTITKSSREIIERFILEKNNNPNKLKY